MPIFLAALRQYPNVLWAAKAAGISRTTAYNWRERDEEFKKAWDEALDEGIDHIELEGMRLAREGNPTMIIFFLKSHRPELYNPAHRIEHSATNDGLRVNVTIVENRPVEPNG